MGDYIRDLQAMFYADRVGKVYGCFKVVKVEYDNERKKQCWTLRCQLCGYEKITYEGRDFVKGKNKGHCKCQGQVWAKHRKSVALPEPKKEKRLRMKDNEQYNRWKGIKRRCYNPNDKDYKNYGGRGIVMCEEWKNDFWKFLEWVDSSGYEKGLTVERIDNNGNYEPSNCKWATKAEQCKNKRGLTYVDGLTVPDYCRQFGLYSERDFEKFNKGANIGDIIEQREQYEQKKDFARLCRGIGLSTSVVRYHLNKGFTFEQIANREHAKGVWTIGGITKTKEEWCLEYDMVKGTVEYRIKTKGMTPIEALTAKRNPNGRKRTK